MLSGRCDMRKTKSDMWWDIFTGARIRRLNMDLVMEVICDTMYGKGVAPSKPHEDMYAEYPAYVPASLTKSRAKSAVDDQQLVGECLQNEDTFMECVDDVLSSPRCASIGPIEADGTYSKAFDDYACLTVKTLKTVMRGRGVPFTSRTHKKDMLARLLDIDENSDTLNAVKLKYWNMTVKTLLPLCKAAKIRGKMCKAERVERLAKYHLANLGPN